MNNQKELSDNLYNLKEGDFVRCVYVPKGRDKGMTLGKDYEVAKIYSNTRFMYLDDKNQKKTGFFNTKIFKKVVNKSAPKKTNSNIESLSFTDLITMRKYVLGCADSITERQEKGLKPKDGREEYLCKLAGKIGHEIENRMKYVLE